LEHAGRAEAVVDLVRLAGLAPVGVLGGILSDDALGMARQAELESMASQYGIVSVRIDTLVRYRRRHEGVVTRFAEARLPTEFGDFRCVAYQDTFGARFYVALVWGDVERSDPVLVAFHTESIVDDVFSGKVAGRRSRLSRAMRSISQDKAGVLLYLTTNLLDSGCTTHLHGEVTECGDVAAQILVDLGVQEISVMPGGESYLAVAAEYGLSTSGPASSREVP